MRMILALTSDYALGKNNDLVVKSKEDMKHFVNYTKGGNIVMGRKTWESLDSKPLPNRVNYVVTSQKYCSEYENIIFIKSLEEAPDDSVVIGGKQIYLLALEDPRLKEISITFFWEDKCPDADVFFEEINKYTINSLWGVVDRTVLDSEKRISNYIYRRKYA